MEQAGDDPGLARLPDPAALIFDLDGTLVDTVGTRIEAWLRTFQEVGVPAERAHVAGLIGIDGRRLAHEVAAAAGSPLDAERAEEIDRRAGELYGALNVAPRPLPVARDLLGALARSDVPWAVATSSRAAQVVASVDALRLDVLPTIVDGSHVAHAKPAPDLLLLAAERLSAPPAGCWCVGDATWDVRAGRAAGMRTIGIATGAVPATTLLEAGADVALDSLDELARELVARGLIGR